MSVSIKYKGAEIASASTEVTKTIKTAGKYCEADILVENTPDGGDAPVINPLSVTANGTYTAPSGVDGYSPVTVNVPQGITPSGKKLITDTSETDVAAFATAQISSDTLLAENIKKDVNILGVVGSFEGGGGGGLNTIDTTVTLASASSTVQITGYDLTNYHVLFLELRCRSTVADVNSGFRLYAGTYGCYNPDNLAYPDIATATTTQGGTNYTHTASLNALVVLQRHILYNQSDSGVFEGASGKVITIGDNSFSFQMGYNLCAGLTYDIKGVWI